MKEEKQKQNNEIDSDVLVSAEVGSEDNNEETKKKNFKLPFKLNLKTLSVSLVICAMFLSVGYLVLSNHLISQGFALNEARQNVEELSKLNRELELNAMNLESYVNINDRIAQLEMVGVGEIEYIEIKPAGVAMR